MTLWSLGRKHSRGWLAREQHRRAPGSMLTFVNSFFPLWRRAGHGGSTRSANAVLGTDARMLDC